MILGFLILSIIGILISFLDYRRQIKNVEMDNFKNSVREYTKIKLLSTKEHINEIVYDLNILSDEMSNFDSINDLNAAGILILSNKMNMFSYAAVVDENGKGYTNTGKK